MKDEPTKVKGVSKAKSQKQPDEIVGGSDNVFIMANGSTIEHILIEEAAAKHRRRRRARAHTALARSLSLGA